MRVDVKLSESEVRMAVIEYVKKRDPRIKSHTRVAVATETRAATATYDPDEREPVDPRD